VKNWPALDAPASDVELLLADLDDYAPSAVEERGTAVRVFFATSAGRDTAVQALNLRGIAASAIDVPDEDWARRSQENISPIVVGRICVTPPWHVASLGPSSNIVIVIEPSMGFGTGHHATTRLCLAALQTLTINGADALDVGTGSGVLALAAAALGATRSRGIDNDPDAIQSATDNLALNPDASHVCFELADLRGGIGAAAADIVTANLTGAVLEQAAGELVAAVRPGGTLIVSGLTTPERPAVEAAFGRIRIVGGWEEDGWSALAFRA
jgi:ribosomal protein L11 methyltransferase